MTLDPIEKDEGYCQTGEDWSSGQLLPFCVPIGYNSQRRSSCISRQTQRWWPLEPELWSESSCIIGKQVQGLAPVPVTGTAGEVLDE